MVSFDPSLESKSEGRAVMGESHALGLVVARGRAQAKPGEHEVERQSDLNRKQRASLMPRTLKNFIWTSPT